MVPYLKGTDTDHVSHSNYPEQRRDSVTLYAFFDERPYFFTTGFRVIIHTTRSCIFCAKYLFVVTLKIWIILRWDKDIWYAYDLSYHFITEGENALQKSPFLAKWRRVRSNAPFRHT
ncbi:hypothetical protein NPIL_57671 [Nephila pilipes]|uniref:Uncharacterized protein n=1 Tax=Nephila pilipes TaxID=299642 RepID=A0A8X6TJF3_NEPPI|nr:hypothetical protein NPIL_57671 [Nephila pilipes]